MSKLKSNAKLVDAVPRLDLAKLFAISSVAFLLTFIISGLTSPTNTTSAIECADGTTSSGASSASSVCGTDTTDVNVSVTGAWTLSVSSSGTLNLDLTPTSSGTFSTITDNLNIYTNIPTGYQLYLNSTSGSTDIYNNNLLDGNGNLSANLPAGTNTNHFTATSGTKDTPITLTNNTWGYSLDTTPTAFAKVALTNDDADSNIYTANTKTPSEGDDIPVTYGFKADTSLTPGTYSTSVTYTAIADAPSYAIQSISPNQLALGDQTDKTFTILTTVPTSELDLGNITAKLVWNDGTTTHQAALSNCMEITQEVSGINYRGAQCSYTGNLPLGIYNIELASSWHNATYVLDKAVSIYTTMQSFTSAQCSSLAESTTTQDNRIILKDSRDQKDYYVSHLADNNCWMVQNLALDGGRTLHANDSNVTRDRTLPANIVVGTSPSFDVAQIYSGESNSTDAHGSVFGNTYNYPAFTATVGSNRNPNPTNESVCPKNWGLPTNTDTAKSYINLARAYNLQTTDTTTATSSNAQLIKAVQAAPLYFPIAGFYSTDGNGSNPKRHNAGGDAHYATKTIISDWQTRIFAFSIDGRWLIQSGWSGFLGGSSVRCVFGS